MRKPFSYANITATLALFFAMSGGALAAKHYLISSTNQISPKVLKRLKGNTGKPGHAGKEGPPGKEGATGKEGLAGKEGIEGRPGKQGPEGALGKEGKEGAYPTVLASGQTESGDWGGGFTAGGKAEYRTVTSFPIPLP